MKELGESSGQVVPEIAFMERWAKERKNTAPEQKVKEEKADSVRTSATSSTSSSTLAPVASTSAVSSTQKQEETGGERASFSSSDSSSLSSPSSSQPTSTLFPSLSACFTEIKEKMETDDEGIIFEVLDGALQKDVGQKGGKRLRPLKWQGRGEEKF
jgi:hypothetical protein